MIRKRFDDVDIVLRHGTSSDWAQKNPVLKSGEIGFDETKNIFKMGDGLTKWISLDPYLPSSQIQKMISDAIENADFGGNGSALTEHINSTSPHPVYDNGPSLALIYLNTKV